LLQISYLPSIEKNNRRFQQNSCKSFCCDIL
jgi:hypothetical protein